MIPSHTPQKNPLEFPTKALQEAVEEEWSAGKKYTPAAMPLTALAYTAIDKIAGREAETLEAILVYLDTDTLSYRAEGQEKLLTRQKAEWDPILHWVSADVGVIWQTTQGVMPMDQPENLHQALREKLENLSAMQLSGFSMAASLCSSLALAYALLRRQIDAPKAFKLSRLEEDVQAEEWGVDEEAANRAENIEKELVSAVRFLRLLEAA